MSEHLSKLSDSLSRYLVLGFPLGPLSLLGILCLGLAAWRSEIALNSKLFVFGLFVFCLSCTMWFLGRIYPVYYAKYTGEELRRFTRSSIAGLVGSIVFGTGTYYFGRLLWSLLHS